MGTSTDRSCNPHHFLKSKKWQQVYHSDMFMLLLLDGWANLVWPYFNIRGKLEDYSGYDPFWKMARWYPYWERMLREVHGIQSESLIEVPWNGEIEFFSMERAGIVAKHIVESFRKYSRFDAIREIVLANRCVEDYSERFSRVKIDFYRKYYHTRTKYRHVSLDEVQEEFETIEDESFDIDNLDTTDWMECFFRRLRGRDAEICKLLCAGPNHQQIADRLGYANHSGVTKRIHHIREETRRFQEEQSKAVYAPPPEPKPSSIKYEIIPFSYKRTT